MNERDDYLFDPAARPDADVKALENALSPLRWGGAERRIDRDDQPAPPSPRRRPWFVLIAAAAAAVFVAWLVLGGGGGDDANTLQPFGKPRQFVAHDEPVTVRLGDLAQITLRPRSELAFVHWRPEQQALFTLARGGFEAIVVPPPKVKPEFFAVDTPFGRVLDQGCRYSLELVDGVAEVFVKEGAVTFTAKDRTAFVPAGAFVRVHERGPDTPCFDDAHPELKKAVAEYDTALARGADRDTRGMTLKMVLAAARGKADSLVLWHLLRDPEPEFREIAEAHLVDVVGAPPGAGKEPRSLDPEEWLPWLRLSAWQR